MMNKQLWYANSTGGVPYTYGEVFQKKECNLCQTGKGRLFNGSISTYTNVIEKITGLPVGGMVCYKCEGKGFTRNLA